MSYRSLARIAPLIVLVAFAALGVGDAAPALGATFSVDATHDAVDASPGDGVCADADGACTLRAAVMETNALVGADEISLPAGTYVLSIPGGGEDAAATGDLDVTDNLAITAPVIVNGAAEPGATVDGAGLDRVLHILDGPSLEMSGVNIQNGESGASGGGIFNDGALTIDSSKATGNAATELGGAVYNVGTLTVRGSSFNGNTAAGGGGIDNAGILTLTANTVSGNVGGGILNAGSDVPGSPFGDADITNSTVSGNSRYGIASGGAITVINTTVAFNNGNGLLRGFTGGIAARNTLVAHNSDGDCDTDFTLSSGHNLDSDGTCGLDGPGDISGGYPGLEPLADNGGPTADACAYSRWLPKRCLHRGQRRNRCGRQLGLSTDRPARPALAV